MGQKVFKKMTFTEIKNKYSKVSKNYHFKTGDFNDHGRCVVIVNYEMVCGEIWRDVVQVVRMADGVELLAPNRMRPCDDLTDALDVASEMIEDNNGYIVEEIEQETPAKTKKGYNARFNKKGNMKTGSMWTWSKLKGNQPIESKYGYVLGSCGAYCEGCSGSCYVNASYRYPSVKDGHARNTIAFRTDLNGSFSELREQLRRAKNKPDIVRINQSGEIETALELALWVETASLYPSIRFYLYTKNFDAVRMVIKQHNDGATMPENITVLISVWHEYGVDAYNEFKRHDFIKAFVYDDGYNYDAIGLEIGSYCMAYDRNGKMDHNITCNKCQKCFNRFHKVIGCYDH